MCCFHTRFHRAHDEKQTQKLEQLKRYWAKSDAIVEAYHEDDLGVWVRVTDARDEELTTHLIDPDGESSNPEPGIAPYLQRKDEDDGPN